MVECKCIRNLVGFATSRPPCVVFTACLTVFAIGLFALGYYMQIGDFDVENTEWRLFVGSLAQKQFCMFDNSTANITMNTTLDNSVNLSSVLVSVTLPVIIRLYPGSQFIRTVTNVSHVTTIVTGSEIGLDGEMSKHLLNLTFTLHKSWSASCMGAECPNAGFGACGVVSLPADIIPDDMPHNYCNLTHAPVYNMVQMSPTRECSNEGVLVKTSVPRYLEDHTVETWTDMGINDWETVNLRLQYSSYFLFVMVISCILYGMIKGRPVKQILSKKMNGQTI